MGVVNKKTVLLKVPEIIQSASRSPPGLARDPAKFCIAPHIFLPNMFKKQDGMLAFWGALFEYFFHLRVHFLSTFWSLEALWGSYGLISGIKKWLGAPNMPQDCPKRRHPGNKLTLLETCWAHFLIVFAFFCVNRGVLKWARFWSQKLVWAPNMPQDCSKRRFPRFEVTFLEICWSICFFVFLYFLSRKRAYEICFFCSSIFGLPERSTGWAHMQSVHASAVQTHFFSSARFLKNSLLMFSFWGVFGATFPQHCNFE